MLSVTRRARQLFHGLFPIPRMGDSRSKIVSPQEALPGRKEPIPVAGKDAARTEGASVAAAHACRRGAAARLPPAGETPGAGRRAGSARGGEEPGAFLLVWLLPPKRKTL